MMVLPEFAKVAKIIVSDFLGTKPGEEFLVLTDTRDREIQMGNVFREAAIVAGARATLMEIPKPPSGVRYGEAFPPPPSVEAAVKNTDVCVTTVLGYSTFLRDACQAGRLRCVSTGTPEPALVESLIRTIGEVDMPKLWKEIRSSAALWNKSDTVRITSKLGTDVTFDIKGLTCYAGTGHALPPINFEFMPPGTTFIIDCAPIKEGTIVFDGICEYGEISDFFSEPIKMKIKNNIIVDVEGDKKLWPLIKPRLDALNDPNIYRLPAHFGIGFNPNAKNDPAAPEWERYRGSFVIGIGDNSLHPYPKKLPPIQAKGHWDCQILKPTIYADGKLIVEDGEILPH